MDQNSDNVISDSLDSDNHETDPVEDKGEKILSLKENWVVIPYITLILIGFIVSILDFVYIQMFVFQLVYVVSCIPTFAYSATCVFCYGGALSKLALTRVKKASLTTPSKSNV